MRACLKLLSTLLAVLLGALLGACAAPVPMQQPHGRVAVLLSTDRPIRSLVFDARHAYLALATTTSRATAVLRGAAVLGLAMRWDEVALGVCALGPSGGTRPDRAPVLATLGGQVYLYQEATDVATEQSLCRLERDGARFAPLDDGLRLCADNACSRLWLTELVQYGQVLLSNAGGGANLLASSDQGRSWQALIGSVGQHACPPAKFAIVGRRLVQAGQCAPGQPWIKRYAIAASGAALAQPEPNPAALPDPADRAIRYLGQAGPGRMLFAGVDGGLMKSSDGGRTFRYVILHAEQTGAFPTILQVLAVRGRPRVLLAGGADASTGAAYLAVSRDAGDSWTDLSTILPGRDGGPASPASVTSLAQDRAGRIVLALALAAQPPGQPQGQLLALTLGGVD